MKGKAWSAEEEKKLRQMLQAGRTVRAIARALGKSRDCVRIKMVRLGLDVVVRPEKNSPSTTTTLQELKLPAELPSVETQLRVLAAALEALQSTEIDKVDILRLRAIIQGSRVYQELLAEYVDYRGIEKKVIELEERYVKLIENKASVNSSGPVPAKMAQSQR